MFHVEHSSSPLRASSQPAQALSFHVEHFSSFLRTKSQKSPVAAVPGLKYCGFGSGAWLNGSAAPILPEQWTATTLLASFLRATLRRATLNRE